jgi:hypothetical protein
MKPFLKKSLIAAFCAVNTVTVISSGMITHRLADHATVTNPEKFHVIGAGILSPVMLAASWLSWDEAECSISGPNPMSTLGKAGAYALSPGVNTAAGIVFSVFGAPGAWVGGLTGATTGFLEGSIRSANKQPFPAPCPGQG